MCISSPDVATVPERQSAKMPDSSTSADRTDDRAKRRMAYAASILTSPTGTIGSPSTTASIGSTKTGA